MDNPGFPPIGGGAAHAPTVPVGQTDSTETTNVRPGESGNTAQSGNVQLTCPQETVNREMVGKAVGFALTDNDPVRIFGLPKKMLLEVCLSVKHTTTAADSQDAVSDPLDAMFCDSRRDGGHGGADGKYAGDLQPQQPLRSQYVFALYSLLSPRLTPRADGRSGCGKSFVLLQAVENCIANGWVVVYIPRAVNLVNSTTPYEYDLRTQTYVQPAFAFQTLQRLQTVNAAPLQTLTTQKKHVFEKREVPQGTSLFDLVGVALKDPSSSPVILDTLMTELSTQTKYVLPSHGGRAMC
jgi:small subunit ribosomal protein S29